MQVVLAQPRGFCAGVVRAIDIVDLALDRYGAPVYVRHEIVHNRHVVESLKAKGAIFVEDLADVPPGAVTIFSAHGVPRVVENDAQMRDLKVIDATCPLVAKVHGEGRRYVAQGRTLVLIGHRGHPEVEGTLGQIPAPVHVVASQAEAQALDLPADTPMAYVTQTTLSVDDTRAIIQTLQERFSDLVGPETKDICYATQNRQTAVRDLAAVADIILVVGSSNSSNSNRLREIASEMGVASHLIDGPGDLDPAWFAGDGFKEKGVVGITAGASAPEVLVQDVIAALRSLGPVDVRALPGLEEDVQFRLPETLA